MVRWHILFTVLAAALPGCTFSVHPILTKSDLASDVDLSGTWEQQIAPDADPRPDPHIVSLEGYDRNTSYYAEYKDGEQVFQVQVGKIGDRRYLQFIRIEMSLEEDSPVLARLPVYGFARFELRGDEVHVFPVHDKEVRKLLKKNDVAYRDYQPYDMLAWCVITDRTPALQKLIREHGNKLFQAQQLVFRRVPAKIEPMEQSHAPKPAIGPDSNRESSPPAR